MLILFTFIFAKRQIGPSNALQEVANSNHFGSVSDSVGRLAAASECMASNINAPKANIEAVVYKSVLQLPELRLSNGYTLLNLNVFTLIAAFAEI